MDHSQSDLTVAIHSRLNDPVLQKTWRHCPAKVRRYNDKRHPRNNLEDASFDLISSGIRPSHVVSAKRPDLQSLVSRHRDRSNRIAPILARRIEVSNTLQTPVHVNETFAIIIR